MSLVPEVKGLFPVGRLDLTTEGLILLTNDGAFAERVSHPRFEVPRVYHAKVRGVPDARTLTRLRSGVRIKDEVLIADDVRLVDVDRHAWVEVTLHEGKQHEVKRLLEAVGHPVSKLRRVAFGPVTLRGLEPGQFRGLEPREIAGLLRGEGVRGTTPRRLKRRPRPGGKGRPSPKKADGRRGPVGRGEGGTKGRKQGVSARKAGTRGPAGRGSNTRRGGGQRTAGTAGRSRTTGRSSSSASKRRR
jgi:23S rRNA pseudouridine2605 synthase